MTGPHTPVISADFLTLTCLAVAKVYPVGIPTLYAAILWKNRELLNPRVNTVVASEPGEIDEAAPREELTKGAGVRSWALCSTSKGQTNDTLSPQALQEFKERVNARREHPDLVPSMFLWKDFGEGCKCIQSPVQYLICVWVPGTGTTYLVCDLGAEKK